ncbi:MAG: hypothetical protein LUE29_09765 [Lachnospiraceae bacterium]|nr:hypothetical protein [Lachnospiraceae bacterium]
MKYVYQGNELYHHGILGQKWGQKNGPPYPLDSSDHSSSEKKAGWKKSLDKSSSDTTKSSIKKLSNQDLREFRQKTIDKQDKDAKKQQDTKTKSEEELEQIRARRKTAAKVAIGVAAAAGIGVGVYFAYKRNAIDYLSMGMPAKDALKTAMSDIDSTKDQILDSIDDTILPAGTTFHRMTAEAGIDFSKMTSPTYVSYKEKDVLTYMTQLKDWSGTGERYDVTLEAIKDIRMPSKEKAQKVFEQLWNEDSQYRNDLQESLESLYYSAYEKQGYGAYYTQGMLKSAAKSEASQALSQDPFMAAVYSIVGRGKDTETFLGKLKDLGYSAIEDYFDKGSFTDSPVVLFDASTSVVKKGEELVTSAMKQLALTRLAQLT